MREPIPFIISSAVQSYGRDETTTTAENEMLSKRAFEQASRAASALFKTQSSDGSWCGDLIGDSTLLSDYILLQLWLYPPTTEGEWLHPDKVRIAKVVRSIWESERKEGGWSLFPGGPAEINATARAYTALKLAGEDSKGPRMRRLRKMIVELGGLQACNSYTKINLSMFGLFPRRFVPTVPPEILIVPGNVLYEMSSWTRTIIVPLAIVQALGAICATPRGIDVEELLHPTKRLSFRNGTGSPRFSSRQTGSSRSGSNGESRRSVRRQSAPRRGGCWSTCNTAKASAPSIPR
jgi:squalene-hopene/tetraprenyl-beta-curcumene cyclase